MRSQCFAHLQRPLLRTRARHGFALAIHHLRQCGGQVLTINLKDITSGKAADVVLRDGDVLARYGGEEFVVLLPDCDAERLTACCERLRIAFTDVELIGLNVRNLSLSAGMTLLALGDDLDDALQRADQALYRAKRDGRNRCAAAWQASDA